MDIEHLYTAIIGRIALETEVKGIAAAHITYLACSGTASAAAAATASFTHLHEPKWPDLALTTGSLGGMG